ncbi:putative SANT/Myb domain, Homeobox-like domain superfamily protein [Septoria linicola]|nr:putative SANT/Myb domain, Homeobox-like domain superfamily protein [Septoria linicola]
MGQTSSQIAAPSQQIDIARTPTPELSDIDTKATRDPVDQNSVMEIQQPEQEHDIRWSPINARKTSINQGIAPVTTISPQPTTKSRPKVTKKRASDGTQRRLLSPRVSKAVASEYSSEEKQQSPWRPRKALPKAALGEDDAPALRPTPSKRNDFSPLRKTKPRPSVPKTPAPVLSSPPQVIIPSSEVVAATQSQALEHHVEALQHRLSQAQSQLQSRSRESVTEAKLTSLVKPNKNVLAELQHSTEGSDWFSKIDEAVAEVAENQRTTVEVIDNSAPSATRTLITKEGPREGHVTQSALLASGDMAFGADKRGHLRNAQHDLELAVSAVNAEHDVSDIGEEVQEVDDVEMEEEENEDSRAGSDTEQDTDNMNWLLPTADEIREHRQQRTLYADDLELEERIEEPQSAWEIREETRKLARNVLREHIVKWNLDRKIYKGLAKYVPGDDGEPVITYAAPGETFKVRKHTKAERNEAKANKDSMTSTRTALHESIVISELEARKIAMVNARQSASPAAHGSDAGSISAEEFVAKQSPASNIDEDVVEEADETNEEHELVDAPSVKVDQHHAELPPEDRHDVENQGVPNAGQDEVSTIVPVITRKVVASPESKPQPAALREKGKEKAVPVPERENPIAAGRVPNRTPSDPLSKKQRKVPRASGSASIGRAVPIALIPTPPKSDEADADPSSITSQPAGVQVGDWLASQSEEPPVPLEQVEQEKAAKTSRKRKRKSSANDDPDFEEVAPEDSNSVTTSARAEMREAKKSASAKKRRVDDEEMSEAPKSKRRRSSAAATEKKPKRSVTMSGPFTQEEKELADKIFDNVLQKEGLRESDLMAQVQNWKMCGTLKTDMFAAFSDRSVESVRKFCQRRWHGQERGPWTPEQDEALRTAYASHPGKWTVISDSVGRTAADCKDRWRSHFESDHINLGPWTVEEEEQLMAAVEECIKVIKKEKCDDPALLRDRERVEALINWRVVSDKLDGKRNTKRCREKYMNIRAIQAKTKNHDVSWSTTQRAKVGEDGQKVAMARRKVAQFEIGDYYDVFVEIHTSFENPHQHFRDEKNVVWSIVSAKNLHSRFSMYSYSSALRRVALETAIETWPANNAKIKRKLDRVDTFPAKALVLAKWIEKTYAGRLDTMTRTYQAELIGKSKEELQALKQARKERFAQGSRKINEQSKDYVTDSEGDDEGPAAMIPSTSKARVPAAVLGKKSESPESEAENQDQSEDEGRDDDGEEEASDVTQTVPDSQFQEDHDVAMSDVESLKGTPSVGPANFIDRLKSSGGSGRRKTVGYGKKDKMKAGRRRTHVH